MKADIHPKYEMATVTCVCGNSFTIHSTVGDIKLEICSECHPFFTGRQKVIDTAGRIDKFNQRFAKSKSIKAAKNQPKAEEGGDEATA
ncbi:MAG: 50S ribosomal protein L31 [Ignavibacteriae bacterium]|nr:50S ribosomal protein L31 [Ignavibacteriota bacterium]MCB9217664.1 50S ribosomal protein L31 [Ignavibacteria bacterium]